MRRRKFNWRSSRIYKAEMNKMSEDTPERQRLRVIMDTNAFFVPLQFRIDLQRELDQLLKRSFEMVLLAHVKSELVLLSHDHSPSTKKDAEYALKLAEKCIPTGAETPQHVPTDDAIVQVAKHLKAAVFTNDRQLRKRLRDISVPVIYVRQKSRLAVDGLI
jgi:hypothetical protein